MGCLQTQKADGLVVIAPDISEKHAMLGQWCRESHLELILCYRDDPSDPDEERLQRALSITNKLGIGTTAMHEWLGGPGKARAYKQMADHYGFEWVCTITHKNVLWDLKHGGRLRRVLGNTLCLCLCGYVLAGYLFDEPRMPHLSVTTLAGRNLHAEFGVTIENLTEYLTPMNILSGAGFQEGLNIGSRVYAKKLGFKGLVIGMPFDLEGTDNITIKPKPANYPQKCGG